VLVAHGDLDEALEDLAPCTGGPTPMRLQQLVHFEAEAGVEEPPRRVQNLGE
jgi:hypothetical protein